MIEQHFHGAFGVNFNTCVENDLFMLADKMQENGICGFFPTLVTDSVENIKRQIAVIKSAAKTAKSILGIHLEGIFLNPEKKGIHDEKLFLKPTIENFQLIEDDFIKIVTLAPELCEAGFIDYLKSKGIKVQAGHCMSGDLSGVDGVTHLFNAMSPVNHRGQSTALSALINDDIYTEIIADGVHLSDEILRLIFKCKPLDKIILVSDCLPCTESGIKEFEFAGETIYFDGKRATSKSGTIAGSTTLLPDMFKYLLSKGIISENQVPQLVENVYRYHNIKQVG